MRFAPYTSKTVGGAQTLHKLSLALSLTLPAADLFRPSPAEAADDSRTLAHQCGDKLDTLSEYNSAEGTKRATYGTNRSPFPGQENVPGSTKETTNNCGAQNFAYDDAGRITLSFIEEKKNNPHLTEREYIRDIAARFKSIESLDRYFKAFFKYTIDTPDSKQPLLVGTDPHGGDYWQMAAETLRRTENGQCLGDCDDLAFLAQAILYEQGKQAIVVMMHNHAMCFWVEESPKGCHARALCTLRYSNEGANIPRLEVADCFDSANNALKELFRRYTLVLTGQEQIPGATSSELITILVPPKAAGDLVRIPATLEAFTDADLYLDLQMMAGATLPELVAGYRAKLENGEVHTSFQLGLAAALRRAGSPDSTQEIEQTLTSACGVHPESHVCRDQFGRFYNEQGQQTKALHYFIEAVRLGSRSDFVLEQITSLTPFLGQYTAEFGLKSLAEALPSIRFMIALRGYPEESVHSFCACARRLGREEDLIHVLAGRVAARLKDNQSMSQAFAPRGTTHYQSTRALADLLYARVEAGQISAARYTFQRLENHAGPRVKAHTLLPSLNYLPYREDTAAFYGEVLESHKDWADGHIGLVEYLYSAGHYDSAIETLVRGATYCPQLTEIAKDPRSMRELKTHPRWPEAMEAIERQSKVVRESPQVTSRRRH